MKRHCITKGIAGKSKRSGYIKKVKKSTEEIKKKRKEGVSDGKRTCIGSGVTGKSKRLGHVNNMDPKLRVIICAKCGHEMACEKGVEYFRYVCPVCKKGKLVRKA